MRAIYIGQKSTLLKINGLSSKKQKSKKSSNRNHDAPLI